MRGTTIRPVNAANRRSRLAMGAFGLVALTAVALLFSSISPPRPTSAASGGPTSGELQLGPVVSVPPRSIIEEHVHSELSSAYVDAGESLHFKVVWTASTTDLALHCAPPGDSRSHTEQPFTTWNLVPASDARPRGDIFHYIPVLAPDGLEITDDHQHCNNIGQYIDDMRSYEGTIPGTSTINLHGCYLTEVFTFYLSNAYDTGTVAGVGIGVAPGSCDGVVAVDDNVVLTDTNPVTIGVLANDYDTDGDPVHIVSADQGGHGTTLVVAGLNILYTPSPDFVTGDDLFSYTISDDTGHTAQALVHVGHSAIDADGDGILDSVDNCRFVPNTDQADLDGDKIGDVCDPDIDGDGLTNTDEAARGTDPRKADTDGGGVPDGLEVAHGTNPLDPSDDYNRPPVANPDSAEVSHDTPTNIDVLHGPGADTDPDGDPLTIAYASTPAHGTTTIVVGSGIFSGQVIRYTPSQGYLGPDSFSYAIADGRGGQAQTGVSVNVVNHAPVAVDDPASGPPPVVDPDGGQITIHVLANDYDVDPPDTPVLEFVDTPILQASGQPSGGVATEIDGSYIAYFPPKNGPLGIVDIPYTIMDSLGATGHAVARIDLEVCPKLETQAGFGSDFVGIRVHTRWCTNGTIDQVDSPETFSSLSDNAACALFPVCVEIDAPLPELNVASLDGHTVVGFGDVPVKICIQWQGVEAFRRTVRQAFAEVAKEFALTHLRRGLQQFLDTAQAFIPNKACRTVGTMQITHSMNTSDGSSMVGVGYKGLGLLGEPRAQDFTFDVNGVSMKASGQSFSITSNCDRKGNCSAPIYHSP